MDDNSPEAAVPSARPKTAPGLKKIPAYWYPYTTMAKGRWLGREILEVVSTEFRDRSMEYYKYALESGVTTVNGKVAKPDTIICNGDRIENVVHRHEPPVTSTPVRIIHEDPDGQFLVIDKPGSIPVHASGRYFRNSLVEILKNDFGYKKIYTVNRLDRLTSGLMIIPLTADCARNISTEFAQGTVQKEYVARCLGEFPEDEVVCEEPLLTVDRQMGLNIVHPEGKPAKTKFNRLHYDPVTNTSVLHCRPLTGRSHQIRVHLQYLGHPIANDPIYSETKIWGDKLGKGGIDTTPSEERTAPSAPTHLGFTIDGNPETINKSPTTSSGLQEGAPSGSAVAGISEQGQRSTEGNQVTAQTPEAPRPKLLPRETGHDIGMGSPVPLSAEAVGVITRLRNMKDEDEDWSRWRDVVFRARGALSPYGVEVTFPSQNRRKRGGPAALVTLTPRNGDGDPKSPLRKNTEAEPGNPEEVGSIPGVTVTETEETAEAPPQLTVEEALTKLQAIQPVIPGAAVPDPNAPPAGEGSAEPGPLYCPECYLPLHPDPKPERLYIFLHALRYTTSVGRFETAMPEWAQEGWTWER